MQVLTAQASFRRFSTQSPKPYATVEGSQQNFVWLAPPHAPASSSTSESLSFLAKSSAVSASLLCPAKIRLGFRVYGPRFAKKSCHVIIESLKPQMIPLYLAHPLRNEYRTRGGDVHAPPHLDDLNQFESNLLPSFL